MLPINDKLDRADDTQASTYLINQSNEMQLNFKRVDVLGLPKGTMAKQNQLITTETK
jgi:hypothetical protein